MSTVAGTSCAVAMTSSTYDSRCNPSLLRTLTPFSGNIPENEIFHSR